MALENLKFYEDLYDGLEETLERDSIGRAMAQKHSFIGAVDAILKNHDQVVSDAPAALPVSDPTNVSEETEVGDHLAREERFCAALENCIEVTQDDLTVELLSHHLKAALIALTSIKSTSLKI